MTGVPLFWRWARRRARSIPGVERSIFIAGCLPSDSPVSIMSICRTTLNQIVPLRAQLKSRASMAGKRRCSAGCPLVTFPYSGLQLWRTRFSFCSDIQYLSRGRTPENAAQHCSALQFHSPSPPPASTSHRSHRLTSSGYHFIRCSGSIYEAIESVLGWYLLAVGMGAAGALEYLRGNDHWLVFYRNSDTLW